MTFWKLVAIMAILAGLAFWLNKLAMLKPSDLHSDDNHDLSVKDFLKGMAVYAALGLLVVLLTGCSTLKEKCGTTPDGDSYCVMYTQVTL